MEEGSSRHPIEDAIREYKESDDIEKIRTICSAIVGILFLAGLVAGALYVLIKPMHFVFMILASIFLFLMFTSSIYCCRYWCVRWKKSREEGWHGIEENIEEGMWCYDEGKWTVRTTSISSKLRTRTSLAFAGLIKASIGAGAIYVLIKLATGWKILAALFLLIDIDLVLNTICRRRKFKGGGRQYILNYELSLPEVLKWCLLQIPSEENVDYIDSQTCRNFRELKRFLRCNDYFGEVDITLVGSTAERYNAPLSPHWVKSSETGAAAHAIITDFDYMISPTDWRAFFSDTERYRLLDEDIKTHCVIVKDGKLQLGHVYVKQNDQGILSAMKTKKSLLSYVERLDIKSFGEFVEEDEEMICSSCFEEKQKNHTSVKIKGPAIELRFSGSELSTDRFWSDITFAIKCDEWPTDLCDWTYREHRKWPCQEDVDAIARQGCHVVPKSQENDSKGGTWRVSFSQAEILLSKLIPPVARMCFIGLKIVAKDHLSVLCDKLSSFQLKCIFLYTLEKNDPSMWLTEENIPHCFETLLLNFLEALMTKRCPHFWIPEINLFEDFTQKQFRKLTARLLRILESPERYIVPFNLLPESAGIELNNRP